MMLCDIANYADDTTLYSKCDQASNQWQQLQLASELVVTWRKMACGINLPSSFRKQWIYNNHLIMGGFNLEPNDSCMKSFLNSNTFTNLIKTNTCFKGAGWCIDLILTK